ncbi:MAG: hypothetical protein U5P41_07195 [Gammaproteobacteria bacterium]|nr:hypothetical protein [Gammaproteobacteria bacterium]
MRALVARARRDILDAHRRNSAAWDTVCRPDLDLTHTLRLAAAQLRAQGKARRLEWRLEVISGEAVTSVQIALSRRYGSQAARDTEVAIPAVPAAAQLPPAGSVLSTAQNSQYGARELLGEETRRSTRTSRVTRATTACASGSSTARTSRSPTRRASR